MVFSLVNQVMGKAEGTRTDWHGHVTALTVGPTFRRLGLAKQLMDILEEVSEKMYVLEMFTEFMFSKCTQ